VIHGAYNRALDALLVMLSSLKFLPIIRYARGKMPIPHLFFLGPSGVPGHVSLQCGRRADWACLGYHARTRYCTGTKERTLRPQIQPGTVLIRAALLLYCRLQNGLCCGAHTAGICRYNRIGTRAPLPYLHTGEGAACTCTAARRSRKLLPIVIKVYGLM
jgi:hypothetical protein